jgi:hypothetical protein
MNNEHKTQSEGEEMEKKNENIDCLVTPWSHANTVDLIDAVDVAVSLISSNNNIVDGESPLLRIRSFS